MDANDPRPFRPQRLRLKPHIAAAFTMIDSEERSE
jgi:hypothetical protein